MSKVPGPSLAPHLVGGATIALLRRILDIGVQALHPHATRGLAESHELLAPSDREALDKHLTAKAALDAARTAVRAHENGWIGLTGPVFAALQSAGLATIDGEAVQYSGTDEQHRRIIEEECAKLRGAVEEATAALSAAPRPDAAIRKAHKSMLPGLRHDLENLRAVLQQHGPLIARPLNQPVPRYGPTMGYGPAEHWTGPSAHDVLAQIVVAALDALDQDMDIGTIIDDDEWEKIRNDVVREAGELARRRAHVEAPHDAPASSPENARFRRAGAGHWDVALNGHHAVVPDSKGMAYVKALLSSPNVPHHVWTLAYRQPAPTEEPVPVVDAEALRAMRAEIDRLESLKAEEVDLEQRSNIDSQIALFRLHLARTTERSGGSRRSRAQRTPMEVTRESVGKAIGRALDALTQQCPEVGLHLRERIATPTGLTPCYACPAHDLPSWLLVDLTQGSKGQ